MHNHVGLCISFACLFACSGGGGGQQPPAEPVSEPAPDEPDEIVEGPGPLPRAADPTEAKRLRAEASGARRAGQLKQARTLLEQACGMEDAPSCLRLAEMMDAGEGGAANPERARELFEMACAAELTEACDALGH